MRCESRVTVHADCLYLLFVTLGVRKHGRHVEHNLSAPEHVINGALSSVTVYNIKASTKSAETLKIGKRLNKVKTLF